MSISRWFHCSAGWFIILCFLADNSFAQSQARQRTLLDAGWRFQLGDPVGDPHLTSSVTNYPEIYYLPKLNNDEFAGSGSETYLETNRVDPVATHAGESVSFVQTNYDDSAWRVLDLPHDWVVELPFDQTAAQDHGYKSGITGTYSPNTTAWYRHAFTLPANNAGQVLWLEFDGVYRNCLVWLNGHILGRNVSGYSSFSFDVTPYANPGGTNVLVVRVDASRFEGWFYEGAGIYRHVWLVAANPVHVAHWGTFVATTNLVGSNATLVVQTDVTNQSETLASGSLTSTIFDASSNAVASITTAISVPVNQHLVVTQSVTITANLWSLQTPYLYNLVSTVSNAAAQVDVCNTAFGVRMVRFDPTNGVFINGQHVEIQGMCNHQDHAGAGSALPDRLQYFRIERLKEMGCNAIRTSHNAPTPELLNACDQLGMLVLDENRRIGTNVEPLFELRNQVMRDRNHPSIFAWSLANEEWNMQASPTGQVVMAVMQNLVHSLDSTRKCTAAINGSLGGTGFTAVLDVQGLNYNIPGNLDSYHPGNPNSPIIGTEVGSTVTTRGIYANDTVNGYVASYDIITLSGLPNPVSWGETAETWWQTYYARPWASGGFDWTGLDYRGEPTPYNWPCINSHFGSMDTCGFPKDLFYYYQANWTLKPVLHVFPHWNWSTPGQPINVWAYGNCQAVELFTNGVSLGRQTLNLQGHVEWDNMPYASGTLQAIGYNNSVAVITNTVVTTGMPAAIALWPDRGTILADGRDVSVVTVAVLDSQGRVVPTAANNITFTVAGGTILGVGNGNPSSHEPDKASQRMVFNGLAEVIVQSTNQPGSITLTATSSGLTSSNITIKEAAFLPAPTAPTGMSAVGENAQVVVSWDIVPGATTYNLWRATTSGGPYTLLAGNIGGVHLGYTDNNVTNLTAYYYVVTANGNGTGVNSAEVAAIPQVIVSGLTATPGNSLIVLNWNASSPGASYNVKRSTVTGGPYTPIATSVSNTNFTDSSVATCQTYFYVVTVTNAGNESLPSVEASASLPGGVPPSPWLNADIGSVGFPGSVTYCNGQFTVSGSGADIWGTVDAFQFVYVYVPISTNCDIRARVVNVQNTSSNAKAAVMIRESLAANSRHALVDVEPSAGIEFLWRTNTGYNTTASVVSGIAPKWVRLTRTNNTFQAYWSPDGNAWTQFGLASIAMANGAYIGLAVCAHDNTKLDTSVIDNVSASFLPANTAPILAPIPNQAVNVGQTVAITASAADTLALTFSLLSAPASAMLTPLSNTNAVFSWRPQVTDANTANLVTIKVADPGSLSATQSFMITVNPITLPSVSSIMFGSGQITLQVTNSQIGPDYSVQESSNLFNWNTLFITNSPAIPFSWVDTNPATLPAQFYRIKVGPPLP
jgi:beta-galactosidase